MRATVPHRYAEALRRAENNVRALFTRRGKQHQRHKIGGDADHNFTGFEFANQRAVIVNFARGANLLQQHAKHILVIQCFRRVIHNDVKAKGFGASTHDVQSLRMDIRGDKEPVGIFQFADALCHRHRFSGGGRFIQQRGGSHVQPRQVQRHLLEVEQRFQTPLRDFRLIRGISGVPAWIFQHVAQDNWR